MKKLKTKNLIKQSPELFTPAQYARIRKISVKHVYSLITNKKIKGVDIAGVIFVELSDAKNK